MEPLTLTIIAITTIVVAIFAWQRYTDSVAEREFARRNLKHVKMGNMIRAVMSKEKLEVTKHETIKKEGPVWGFSMMGKYTIMVADPELVQQVLSNQFTNFTNRRVRFVSQIILGKFLNSFSTFFQDFPALNSFMENSLFFVPDEKWKRLRSIATPGKN